MRAMEVMMIAALILAGCSREAPAQDPKATGAREPAIAPAIVSPSDVADPAEPPSYEVAIASAAADRNKSLERCLQQPEAVRTQCEQEANAAFAERESSLQDLRGNQQ